MNQKQQLSWILIIVGSAIGTALLSRFAERLVDPVVDRWFDTRRAQNG